MSIIHLSFPILQRSIGASLLSIVYCKRQANAGECVIPLLVRRTTIRHQRGPGTHSESKCTETAFRKTSVVICRWNKNMSMIYSSSV